MRAASTGRRTCRTSFMRLSGQATTWSAWARDRSRNGRTHCRNSSPRWTRSKTPMEDARFGDLTGVRGRLIRNAPLAPFTWFQVGGPADLLFQPADADDLAFFLQNLPADVPLTVVGVGSNLLVRDGGVDGVVIRLSAKGFGQIVK